MTFTTGIALALSAVLSGTPASALATQMPQAQTVKEYVTEYFANEPIMIAIAGCESNFTQYDSNGDVLHNSQSSAVGVFQIMSSIHASMADKELGVDIDTLQGNVAYAQYLYQKQGTAPWKASKACWSKSDAAKELAIAK